MLGKKERQCEPARNVDFKSCGLPLVSGLFMLFGVHLAQDVFLDFTDVVVGDSVYKKVTIGKIRYPPFLDLALSRESFQVGLDIFGSGCFSGLQGDAGTCLLYTSDLIYGSSGQTFKTR